MSEPKFTPGPWRIHYGTPICIEAERMQVAEVTGIDERENIINAALIAAAPDLYAALIPLGYVTHHDEIDGHPDDIIHIAVRRSDVLVARAALKKASGEA